MQCLTKGAFLGGCEDPFPWLPRLDCRMSHLCARFIIFPDQALIRIGNLEKPCDVVKGLSVERVAGEHFIPECGRPFKVSVLVDPGLMARR
jgi:hypothetical protein